LLGFLKASVVTRERKQKGYLGFWSQGQKYERKFLLEEYICVLANVWLRFEHVMLEANSAVSDSQ
jgi:hypothetical protein